MDNILKYWLDEHAILIGSRAFKVGTPESDWDYVIHKSQYNELKELLPTTDLYEISNYLNVIPLGNSSIIRLEHLDILIYDRQTDIKITKVALRDMEKIPRYLLMSKKTRCFLFEEILIHYGFKRKKNATVPESL